MDYINLGQQVHKYRTQMKLTQEKLAQKVGVSAKYISNIERGKVKLSVEVLVGMANVFGCSVDFLLKASLHNARDICESQFAEEAEGFTEEHWEMLRGFAGVIRETTGKYRP